MVAVPPLPTTGIRSDNFLFRLSRPVFPKIKTNLFICYYFISFIMLQTPDVIKRLDFVPLLLTKFGVTPNKNQTKINIITLAKISHK